VKLTETFPTRFEALEHAVNQQRTYRGARVLVSGSVGCWTVTTTLPDPAT
jgi:hypothetical protein